MQSDLDNWTLFQRGSPKIEADIFVVSPHGSQPLLMVLKELERGTQADFTNIPNLALLTSKVGLRSPRDRLKRSIMTMIIPLGPHDDLPMRIPVRTSIGCPYRCRFCDFCYLYPKIFLRSQASLLAELQMIKRVLGNKSSLLHVTDDNVFINAQRVQHVCQAIIASGIRGWAGFMRSS